ncbi:ATP-binding protein [Bifidobacterium cuniculi]|uniref:Signal transduction histidine kinase n=1 Tax=Bifidobacterium cuniculi TaxID=1688 RepID=A0A087B3I2_9BIFI|nr:ATP-binding protein [Bifidobacterium cuniculi]KFI65582.1 signal transduction histidine kinase [Bifidobacterium cuniculi]
MGGIRIPTYFRAHPFMVSGVAFCVLSWILEWQSWHGLTPLEIAVSVIYLLLTVGIALSPLVFSGMVVALALADFPYPPVLHGPTIIWGTWLALGILGYSCRMRVSIPATILVSLGAIAQELIRQVPLVSGDITFACSFLLAGLSGVAMRRNHELHVLRERVRQREIRQEHQRQDLRMLRKLHDDIGGTLAYAIRICQNGQLIESTDALRSTLASVEQELSSGLSDLRSNVLLPLSASTGTSTDIPRPARPRGKTHELATLISSCRQRLCTAGFDGIIHIRGSLSAHQAGIVAQLLPELCNNILKHGQGTYRILVLCDPSGSMRLCSSNPMRPLDRGCQSRQHGLGLVAQFVQEHGGTVTTMPDGDEWHVLIDIPA